MGARSLAAVMVIGAAVVDLVVGKSLTPIRKQREEARGSSWPPELPTPTCSFSAWA